MKSTRFLTVSCPKCGAMIGQCCIRLSGTVSPTKPHTARRNAFYKLSEKPA